MRMAVCISAAIAALTLCYTAAAQGTGDNRWEHLGQASGGPLVSLDTRTIIRNGGITSAWVRFTYMGRPPEPYPKTSAYTNVRFQFDCVGMRSTIVYSSTSDKDGAVLVTDEIPAAFTPIVPDSVSEMIWQRVCRS